MIKKILFFLLSATTLFAANSLNNVTVSEYSKFLNTVAQEDSCTLYDQKMGEESGVASIERLGSPGNYSYRFNEEQAEESVMFVDLRSAMRFCNWKENGEQEDPETTENGVYELEGDQLVSVHIDDTTNYFLPSEQDEKLSSIEGVCLRLGSLGDPASWLRSNQVVFHLKGRLENMEVSLSHEEPSSLKQDAKYVVGTLAGIAALATCFKYRDHFYPRRVGDERIPGRGTEARLRDITANGSAGGGKGNEQRRDPSQLHAREGTTTSASAGVPEEIREKRLHTEVQRSINQQILPRTQAVDLILECRIPGELIEPFKSKAASVRANGEKYIQFFNNNFENIFQYQARTDALGKLMEPYTTKLEQAVKQPTSPTVIGRIASVVSDSLAAEHKNIMAAANKYCSDFDASWAKALEATQKQHDFFTELQVKGDWLNTAFPDLVREKKESINTSLNEGAVGELRALRTNSIKKFFEQTFRKEFVADQQAIERRTEAAKAKLPGWYQQFEELRFWSPDQAEGAAQHAQELVQLADQETATLMNAYEDWKKKTEHVIARAEQRYDAVNHQWPADQVSSMTAEHKKLVESAIGLVHTEHEIYPFYPSEEEEQRYYQQWIQRQYDKIQQALYNQRSILSLTTYTSPIKGTLPEHEKEVLRYFLNGVDASPVDFIRAKAAALRTALDPDLGSSDDSDDGF
ncbi:MAG: hypothetical protein K2W97_00760 [Chthoniobacterales bacterium]|nr:hypothetical protein [Chthoniobacterales bacterium]